MRKKKLFLGTGVLAAGVILVWAANDDPPAWWNDVGVSGTAHPKSPVNLGQVKNMAHHFHDELNRLLPSGGAGLPGGAGFNLNEIFPDAPPNPSNQWLSDQLVVANLGQLKYVASYFYERLNILVPDWVSSQMDLNGIDMQTWEDVVPWDESTPIDENYRVAVLGQLKLLFSLRTRQDTDNDGIPDLQEHLLYGKHVGEDGSTTDFDGDGLKDNAELLTHGTSPFEADTDGDGFNDKDDPNPLNAEDDGSTTNVTSLRVLTPFED